MHISFKKGPDLARLLLSWGRLPEPGEHAPRPVRRLNLGGARRAHGTNRRLQGDGEERGESGGADERPRRSVKRSG